VALVLVVGDVINDIVVRVRGGIAAGSDTPAEILTSPGGSGANQAAWLGVLGAPVRFAGRVGTADAERHRAALTACGVDARLAEDAEVPTGTVVVLVEPDGGRSMLTDRGANLGLAAADLPPALLDGATHLHLSGYASFAAGTRDAVWPLRERADALGVPTSVDPASASFLRDAGAEAFLDWAAGARIVFPNIDEGQVLTGRVEPDEIVDALLGHFPIVALKAGADGAVVAAREGSRLRCRAESAAGSIVDTTGAGDAFCAGFLAAWVAGLDLAGCAGRAARAAATAVRQLGARPASGRPDR
jgi:sugar/nucleoside kinase (ribokinase family)